MGFMMITQEVNPHPSPTVKKKTQQREHRIFTNSIWAQVRMWLRYIITTEIKAQMSRSDSLPYFCAASPQEGEMGDLSVMCFIVAVILLHPLLRIT